MLLSFLGATLSLAACRETIDYNAGKIDFEPDRPRIRSERPRRAPHAIHRPPKCARSRAP
jgi:hypothetical protein